MKKYYAFIFLLLIIFSTFLVIKYIPKNYIINYKLDSFNVKEQFIKSKKEYLFNITYNQINYPVLISKKYTSNRKLISKISLIKEKNIICLNINIDNKVYPTCSNNNELVDYRTLSDSFLKKKYHITRNETKKLKDYQKINIFNYKNINFYVWNYKGFYLLFKNNNKTIYLLKNDKYENELTYQSDRYLIIPNYDSKYFFYNIKYLKFYLKYFFS